MEKFRAAYTRAAAILSASTLAYRPRRLQPGAPGIGALYIRKEEVWALFVKRMEVRKKVRDAERGR